MYVERQNVPSNRSAAIDARCNVKSKDHRDPAVRRETVDKVTSSDVTCGDISRGDITSVKVSPSRVSISGHDEELRAEATGSCKICHAEQG